MKLISWNVNGIRSAHGKTLPQLVADCNPDVLCLQETKVHCETLIPSDDSYRAYTPHSSYAITRKGYSGVTTFTSAASGLTLKSSASGFGEDICDREGRTVINDYGPFILYNMYFPSGTTGDIRQQFKYDFLACFKKHLSALPAGVKDRLVICGDFNICHKDIDIHHPKEAEKRELSGFLPEERKWMDEFSALGYVDAYRCIHGDKPKSYTWWSFRANSRAKNLGWRIDYFFVSKALEKKIQNAEILADITDSDHCPITLELNL